MTRWLIALPVLVLVSALLVWWPRDSEAQVPTTERKVAEQDEHQLRWDWIRDDERWTYANWDAMSAQMFLARAATPDPVLAAHDRDGDGQVDPGREEAYTQAAKLWRWQEEQTVADHIFSQFDTNTDGRIDGDEMTELRARWSAYCALERNTEESCWAFVVLSREIADANGNRNCDAAEQAILSRIEELCIWPPFNPPHFADMTHPPQASLQRQELYGAVSSAP